MDIKNLKKKELKDFINKNGFFFHLDCKILKDKAMNSIMADKTIDMIKTGIELPDWEDVLIYKWIASQNYWPWEKSRNGYKYNQKGWSFDDYFKNPLILFQHNVEEPIWHALSFWYDKAKNLNIMFFVYKDTLEWTDRVRVEKWLITALSTGAMTDEYKFEDVATWKLISEEEAVEKYWWGWIYDAFCGQSETLILVITKATMLENSLVTIWSNEEAMAIQNWIWQFAHNKAEELKEKLWDKINERKNAVVEHEEEKEQEQNEETTEENQEKELQEEKQEEVSETINEETTDEVIEEVETEINKVVSYKSYSLSDEWKAWDWVGAKKRLKDWATDWDTIDYVKYSKGFTWYDEENSETLWAYKLPHHDVVDWWLETVWGWVKAAMWALLGARGGADIPEEERKAVYKHLSKHYSEFEKEAPEFNEIKEEVKEDLETPETIEAPVEQDKIDNQNEESNEFAWKKAIDKLFSDFEIKISEMELSISNKLETLQKDYISVETHTKDIESLKNSFVENLELVNNELTDKINSLTKDNEEIVDTITELFGKLRNTIFSSVWSYKAEKKSNSELAKKLQIAKGQF